MTCPKCFGKNKLDREVDLAIAPCDTCKGRGEVIGEGDVVHFTYGIPPLSVHAPVVTIHDKLFMLTPDHNPKQISVEDFLLLDMEYDINEVR